MHHAELVVQDTFSVGIAIMNETSRSPSMVGSFEPDLIAQVHFFVCISLQRQEKLQQLGTTRGKAVGILQDEYKMLKVNIFFSLCSIMCVLFKNIDEQLTLCSLEAWENITSYTIAMSHNPSLVPVDLDEDEDIDVEEYFDKVEDDIWAQLTQ